MSNGQYFVQIHIEGLDERNSLERRSPFLEKDIPYGPLLKIKNGRHL